MMFPFLSLLIAAPAPTAPDSLVRSVAVAPAESLRVTEVGPAAGPTVVIIPGLISPAFAYRKVLGPLADSGVRAIVVEPLGVGNSSHPGNADYSHTAQAARVAAALDTLGVGRAVIMGHAVGTSIALRLALARPELVSSLVLVEGGALESPAVPGVKTALKFAFLIRIFGGRGKVRSEVRKGLIGASYDGSWVTDSIIEQYTLGSAGDMGGVLRALKGMQKSAEPDSLKPQLTRIQVPVRMLLAAGPRVDGGHGVGQYRIESIEKRVPQFSFDSLPHTGLHINEERPDLLVAELLAAVHQAGW